MASAHPHDPDDAALQVQLACQNMRDALAETFPAIGDRDLFMQRMTQVVASASGQPHVALYTRSAAGSDLSLRWSTLSETGIAPPRIPVEPLAGGIAELSATPEHRALVVPIAQAGRTLGALVLFGTGGSFAARERAVLGALADEIAPAISVVEQYHAVKQSSVLDLETGAYAGWFLSQRLEEEIARAQRTGRSVTVVLVSVLDFSQVRHAHPFERVDTLLRDLAAELAGVTRLFDIVARRGPGEFAILLPDSDVEGAGTVIERIRSRVARVNEHVSPAGTDGLQAVPIRVVTGLASFPADGDRVATLLLAAEHRLNEDELQQRRLSGST
jgi:diguanylate cyclase (GGDEF)-like protein